MLSQRQYNYGCYKCQHTLIWHKLSHTYKSELDIHESRVCALYSRSHQNVQRGVEKSTQQLNIREQTGGFESHIKVTFNHRRKYHKQTHTQSCCAVWDYIKISWWDAQHVWVGNPLTPSVKALITASTFGLHWCDPHILLDQYTDCVSPERPSIMMLEPTAEGCVYLCCFCWMRQD